LASRTDANYNLSANEIFTNLARNAVSGPEGLRVLGHVQRSTQESPTDLPSWVPDWSVPSRVKPLSELCHPQYFLEHHRAQMLKLPSPDILKLLGESVDTIRAVGDVYTQPSDLVRSQIMTSWRATGAQQRAQHGIIGDPMTDLWNDVLLRQRGASRSQQRFNQAFDPVCLERRYFVSATGRSGIGPAAATNGDNIVQFQGTPLPLVLRLSRQDGSYYLVGECCLFGPGWSERKRRKPRVFCIE
jgi:hypothetical protein